MSMGIYNNHYSKPRLHHYSKPTLRSTKCSYLMFFQRKYGSDIFKGTEVCPVFPPVTFDRSKFVMVHSFKGTGEAWNNGCGECPLT